MIKEATGLFGRSNDSGRDDVMSVMKTLKLNIIGVFLGFVLILLSGTAPAWAADTDKKEFVFAPQWTLQQLADSNGFESSALLKRLKLEQADASRQISEIAGAETISVDEIKSEAKKLFVEKQTEKSKNWQLIFIKFTLWVLLLTILAVIMNRKKAVKYKPLWLVMSAVVFGAILGSDPNPLGVVKDGIVLYANEGVLFKPRFMALGFLLLLVLVFSRIFCGWACQIGVVQELLFRHRLSRIKLPFWLTNSVRVSVFAAMLVFALGFHMDLLGYVDPFKIYSFSFSTYTALYIGFILLLIMSSLFIYRPWCTLACPFGLIAWVVNRLSIFKMRFQRADCTGCGACVEACPAGAIKKVTDKGIRAECFMCNRCREACPADAIKYGRKL